MKCLLIKNVFLCIVLQTFFSCQTTPAKGQRELEKIEKPKDEKPKIVKVENLYDFFLAGDNLWIFFKDRLEIVKGPTEKEVIFFKRFKSEHTCQKIFKRKPSYNGVEKGHRTLPGFTDCIPRPTRVRKGGLDWYYNEIFDRGYWVLQDEVVIELGRQLYFFTFDGKFLRIEDRKKGWQFEELPFSKYGWRYNEKEFHFDGKKFEHGNPSVFSGPWVLRIEGSRETKKFHLIERSTAKYHQIFEATKTPRGTDKIEFREYGDGFYIDQNQSLAEVKNDIFHPPRRPAWWFGKTVIDLKNDDPTTHCYVFKEKKKCVPISIFCTLVNGKQKCIPRSKRSYPKRFLRGVLETDKMLIRIYDEELGIEFKTK